MTSAHPPDMAPRHPGQRAARRASAAPSVIQRIAPPVVLCAFLLSATASAPCDLPDRPSAEEIRRSAEELVSRPPFKTAELREGIRQRFARWLNEHIFSRLGLDDAGVVAAVLRVLLWFALVGGLVVITWMIVSWIRDRRGVKLSALPSGRRPSRGGPQASIEQLLRSSAEFRRQGKFREATSSLLEAVLRWLEDRGLVRRSDWKTNEQYRREYLQPLPGAERFCRFARGCDTVLYGPGPFRDADVANLAELWEQVQSDVEARA